MHNRLNIFSFAKRIGRPLILDGAIGSLLIQYGLKADNSIWTSAANLEASELVLKVHKEYIDAGADIITANTFRTNPIAVKNNSAGLTSPVLVKRALDLAIKARNSYPVLIAGSNAPAEDCYQAERKISKRELEYNHHRHINLLMENGCDFILNETQSHMDEIHVIGSYCRSSNIPFIISLFFTEKLRLLSGESLQEAIETVISFDPLAIGFNCIKPETLRNASELIPRNYNWGLYLNCGSGSFSDTEITCGITPEDYLNEFTYWKGLAPSFIGACCGSAPEHIAKLKSYFNGLSGN